MNEAEPYSAETWAAGVQEVTFVQQQSLIPSLDPSLTMWRPAVNIQLWLTIDLLASEANVSLHNGAVCFGVAAAGFSQGHGKISAPSFTSLSNNTTSLVLLTYFRVVQ